MNKLKKMSNLKKIIDLSKGNKAENWHEALLT